MSFSPGVWGRSRYGESVFASEQVSDQIDEILAILVQFGRAPDRMLTDARHLHTAIRYVADAFVTRDRFLLNGSEEIRARFRLRIVTPEEAADTVCRLAQRAADRSDR